MGSVKKPERGSLAQVMRIKQRAAFLTRHGIIFHCKDLKAHFSLECSLVTLAKALRAPGKVPSQAGRGDAPVHRNLPCHVFRPSHILAVQGGT